MPALAWRDRSLLKSIFSTNDPITRFFVSLFSFSLIIQYGLLKFRCVPISFPFASFHVYSSDRDVLRAIWIYEFIGFLLSLLEYCLLVTLSSIYVILESKLNQLVN